MADLKPTQSNILIVEDESIIRMMVSDSLIDWGFAVSEAETGEAALRSLESDGAQISAVILDVGLPDINGDVLMEKLRTLRPDVPIIVTTGYDITDMGKKFAYDGRIKILAKPYFPEDINVILKAWGL